MNEERIVEIGIELVDKLWSRHWVFDSTERLTGKTYFGSIMNILCGRAEL